MAISLFDIAFFNMDNFGFNFITIGGLEDFSSLLGFNKYDGGMSIDLLFVVIEF